MADVRVCRTEKKGYSSQSEARAALGRIRAQMVGRQDRDRDVPNNAFRCSYCQEWHLSHHGQNWKPKKNTGGWKPR